MRHCWKCRADYPPETVVCVRCGINLATGEEIPKQEPEEPPLTPWEKVVATVADLTPGLLRPIVWIPSLLLAAGGWGVIIMGGMLIQAGVILSGVPVAALGLIMYAQAAVWMIMGQFWLMHTALVEFQGRHWTIFAVAVFGPGIAFILVLKFLAGGHPE
jgi:hypothetical protein